MEAGKLEAVNNEVRGLKTALIEGFDEMKDVLVKMEGEIEKTQEYFPYQLSPLAVRNTANGGKENIYQNSVICS
jgi:hypothetical protein